MSASKRIYRILTLPARYWEAWTGRGAWSRFAGPVRRAIFFSRFEASSFGSCEIAVEHLLLGVLRENKRWLDPAAAAAIVRQIEATGSRQRAVQGKIDLPLTEDAKKVLKAAMRGAARSGATQVESRHLLASMLQQQNSRAARLLRENEIDASKFPAQRNFSPYSPLADFPTRDPGIELP
jgi:ATP-dependent Clp protease ATP-binding subunit ClpA